MSKDTRGKSLHVDMRGCVPAGRPAGSLSVILMAVRLGPEAEAKLCILRRVHGYQGAGSIEEERIDLSRPAKPDDRRAGRQAGALRYLYIFLSSGASPPYPHRERKPVILI